LLLDLEGMLRIYPLNIIFSNVANILHL